MGIGGNEISIWEDERILEFKARGASHTKVLKHVLLGHIWHMRNEPAWSIWVEQKAK